MPAPPGRPADKDGREVLLKRCAGVSTARQVDLVLDLLLVDEANPRSIAFQLARLREHIGELPGSKTSIRRPAEERIALSLLNTVQLIDVREMARAGERAAAEAREGLLGKLISDLSVLSDTLSRAYFSHAAQSRRL